jgi:hypothetical protein
MNARRSKLIFMILVYAYRPAAYFGIYLPFIVPRLDQWNQIPLWIPIVLVVGFIYVLANLGMRSSTKGNILHAVVISVANSLFLVLLALLNMPGFKKWEGFAAVPTLWVFVGELMRLVLFAVPLFAVAEGGRILLAKKGPLANRITKQSPESSSGTPGMR